MKDAAGTNLTPGNYVIDERGRVYAVRPSGTVYTYGHRIVCQPLRPCGGTWAERGAEVWLPVPMVFRVRAGELQGDLAALWLSKMALLRPAIRERLRQRRMQRR
jgi:hypothetical protein